MHIEIEPDDRIYFTNGNNQWVITLKGKELIHEKINDEDDVKESNDEEREGEARLRTEFS